MERKEILSKIIIEAGKETLKFFDKPIIKFAKSHEEDYATQADIASEKIIIDAIKKNFPKDGIISEESKNYKTDAEYVWIIDPLDGTWNFAHGIPIYAVLIAVARKGEIVLGGMYFPKIDDYYFAEKGKGAFRNGQKIACSSKADMNHLRCGGYLALVDRSKCNDKVIQFLEYVQDKDFWLTEFGGGAYDMALTASGRGHCFISPAILCGHIWDLAAPAHIMKEAGCKVTDFDGKLWQLEHDSMIAANPNLHADILKAMQAENIMIKKKAQAK